MNNIKKLKFNKVVYRMFGTKIKKAEQEYKRCLSMKDAKKEKTPPPLILSKFAFFAKRWIDLNFKDFAYGYNVKQKEIGYFLKLDTMHAVYAVKLDTYDKFIVFHFFAEIDSPTLYLHIIQDDKELVFYEEQHLGTFEMEYIDDDKD